VHIGIDTRLPFYQKGGISQYTIHLITALAQIDQENQYHLFHLWKDKESYLPTNHPPNFHHRTLYTPCHHKLERWSLSAELLPRPYLDLWHSPDFIPPQFNPGRNVITVHDLNFIYYPQFLTADSRRYYLDQIEWAVQKADHISADSHHSRRDLIEQLNVPPEKVTTVHLSVNPLYQKSYQTADIEATLAKHNLPKGFILAVGTLEPRKNLPMLIEVYHHLRQSGKVDVPLVLVGRKGWLFEEIFDTINKFKLQDHVHHLSGVYDEALAHLYHAAGVLVTPSHYEGFGLPALEAQNCGCPVIVSERGSLPEIAGNAGKILPADDVNLWVETIGKVLTDSQLRQDMIERGFTHCQTFSWRHAAETTRHIYQSVLS